MTFWTNPHFKALQRAWYQRLEEDGFEDVERLIDGEPTLRVTDFTRWSEDDGGKEAYYHFVSSKIKETTFTSDVDRIILERHAEGRKIRHIREELESMGQRRCRNTICFKIRVYQAQWGIKTYTPKQLNRRVG